MATPQRTTRLLRGALGEIAVDLRCGDHSQPRPAVVLAHGFKGSKDSGFLPRIADRLARAGFLAVGFTTSGAGVDADGRWTRPRQFHESTYSADLEDFLAVLRALDAETLDAARPTSIGLLGFSRGGGMAVLVAADTPRVSALVTWAAIARARRWTDAEAAEWRERGTVEVVSRWTGQSMVLGTRLLEDCEANAGSLDILDAARRLRAPWLLVHGTADETVPVLEGRELSQAAPDAATALWLDGADHHFDTAPPGAVVSPAFSRALDATVRHFARYLR